MTEQEVVKFRKGDRIGYSAMAFRNLIRRPSVQNRPLRRGTVVMKPRGSVVSVLWDGRRTLEYYCSDFLEKIEGE